MWCLRGYYFKMAPGNVKKAIQGNDLKMLHKFSA